LARTHTAIDRTLYPGFPGWHWTPRIMNRRLIA
jgi:hypothetical protein